MKGEIIPIKSNQIKSAIGNNGMFDMTNPNIYKSIIGGATLYNFIPQDNNKFKSGGVLKRIKNGVKFTGKNYIK